MKVVWVSDCPLHFAQGVFSGQSTLYSAHLKRKDQYQSGPITVIFAYNSKEYDYIKWLGKLNCEVLIVFSHGENRGLKDFFLSFTSKLLFFQGMRAPKLELPRFLSNWLGPYVELWWANKRKSDFQYLGFEIMSSFEWQRSITRRNLWNCLKILWEGQKL